MEGLSLLAASLASLAGPTQILYALGATLAGMLIGILPGLSATLGIALFTTLTVRLAPTDAILILVCVYVGAIYGGSRTAILLNIPGTAANAGVNVARQTTPNIEPITEPVVAMPIARPALPWRASMLPSRHAAAFAAVPGMLSRIAVRLPP